MQLPCRQKVQLFHGQQSKASKVIVIIELLADQELEQS
jgi:hypothetical protein